MLWLIGGALLSVLIVSAGFMIDRQTALSERGRIEQTVLERLQHAKSEIETQIARDIDLALALADDIADDGMMSPPELNRTIERMLKVNSHFRSIRFAPLTDPKRMAFTALISQAERGFTIDIPVPPLPWQGQQSWISLIVDIDGDGFFGTNRLLAEEVLPGQEDHDHTKLAVTLPSTSGNDIVFGDASLFDEQPVSLAFTVDGLPFRIYGVPTDGWDAAMNRLLPSRLLVLAGVVAMMISVLLAVYLLRERNLKIARLRGREQRLLELSERFQLALETSNIGI